MAAKAGLCLAWSETPEDTFCRVVAHEHVYNYGPAMDRKWSLSLISC